jgi:hypothetical protein
MFSALFARMGRKFSKPSTSEFSRFFREAKSREKKKVFLEVARKASEEQRKTIQGAQVAH